MNGLTLAFAIALFLAGCVTNAPQPVACFACGGPHVAPYATPLQWSDCARWCVIQR